MTDEQNIKTCTAFSGDRCVASGNFIEVVQKVKKIIDQGEVESIFIFDDATSELVEVDFRGKMEDVLRKVKKLISAKNPDAETLNSEQNLQRKPGRPKLGVVGREVTLLPRHWRWLNSQPGGASVTLRKLVEQARRANHKQDKVRQSQEATLRFMTAMAGNLPGFEEATRALYAGNPERYNEHIILWPKDIKNYALKLSKAAFQN